MTLLASALLLLAVQSLLHELRARPQFVQERVDLNRADRAELMLLPGVGEKLAERIVAHRPYQSVSDLTRVPGLGPSTLERLRDWAVVSPPPTALPAATLPQKAKPASKAPISKISALDAPIDVNAASVEDLQRLPGIGPKLSQRIVAERGKKPFVSIDDLDRVPGIGPKTIAKVRPFVVVR